jgi:hypothetical protein
MPRKLKQKQKQKQSQRQSIVVNVGEVRRKRRATGARRRAPKQTIEEAEYIAALNRTMPAVQINPIPATQQIPMLSQEQAFGLLQSALSSRPSGEKSLAQKDVERRDAAAKMQQTNDALESTLSRIRSVPSPEIPGFSFTPPKNIVPQGEPGIPTTAIPLMAGPSNQELTTIADKPKITIRVPKPMSSDNQDMMSRSEAGFPIKTLAASVAQPLDRPDGNFDFNATTRDARPMPSGRAESVRPAASRMTMASRIAERFGTSKEQGLQRYEKEISDLMAAGRTRKAAQDILTKRYKYEDVKEQRLEERGLVSRMKSRPAGSAAMTEPQREMIYVNL